MQSREIIVVGGGMVGALSALLLAQQGNKIHLIEKNPITQPNLEEQFDLRVSAFSAQSKSLLSSSGVWSKLPEQRVCAYQGLQTWEAGSSKLCFDSQDINAHSLGYIIENRWVQAVLWQALEALDNVTFYKQLQIQQITQSVKKVEAVLSDNSRVEGELLLACDGANSRVCELLHFTKTSWDYRQHCLLINIKTDTQQQSVTWQEFRETGPCAFLPLAGNAASLVWYHSPEKIAYLNSLNQVQLKQVIVDEFPDLDFDFTVLDKGSFPLKRSHAHNYYQGNVVLLGDAAHTINPLAGQGVNLGFKDVECLVDLLVSASDLPLAEILKRYQCQRKPANLLMQTGMDLFYKVSKSERQIVASLRRGFLHLAEHSGLIKQQVMRYAMGIK